MKYNIINLIDKELSDLELQKIINKKLYNIINCLELNEN